MGRHAKGARAADVDKTHLQAIVIQERRVLDGKNQALRTAAFHHRFLVLLEDMITLGFDNKR